MNIDIGSAGLTNIATNKAIPKSSRQTHSRRWAIAFNCDFIRTSFPIAVSEVSVMNRLLEHFFGSGEKLIERHPIPLSLSTDAWLSYNEAGYPRRSSVTASRNADSTFMAMTRMIGGVAGIRGNAAPMPIEHCSGKTKTMQEKVGLSNISRNVRSCSHDPFPSFGSS